MRKQLVATVFVTLSLAFAGHAFAQTQNSSDAGNRNDPDAASDVRKLPPPAYQAPASSIPKQNSTDAGKRTDPDEASDVRHAPQQAAQPPGSSIPRQNSMDAGSRTDPDAASDVREGASH
ncbi:MAG TPA: hypothetical protein VGP48_00820 [Stellaceae bacterium]|jgi:hypothetical protein|nr:hypothetical protein [Stellaceae bacterium]